jgi:hypothetical protein
MAAALLGQPRVLQKRSAFMGGRFCLLTCFKHLNFGRMFYELTAKLSISA